LTRKKDLDENGIDNSCGEYPDEENVNQALRYIGKVFPSDVQKEAVFPHPFYSLYGIERAGRLTGRRFFGEKDWYRVGCEYLVATQKANGSWDGDKKGFDYWPPVATSFSLLFLSKGRTPVLISKMAHGAPNIQGEGWNNKRNDVRHVVEFCSKELFDN